MSEAIAAGEMKGSDRAGLHSVQVGARSLCSQPQSRGRRQKISGEGTGCETFSVGMKTLNTDQDHYLFN